MTRRGLGHKAGLLIICLAFVASSGNQIAARPTAVVQPSPGLAAWSQITSNAAAHATTAFALDVLKDGTVTREEYEQSVQVLVACGRSRGQTITLRESYGLYEFSVQGQGGDTIFRGCMDGDIAMIQAIYSSVYKDPLNRGWIVMFECLDKAHALPLAYHFQEATFGGLLDIMRASTANDGPASKVLESCLYDPLGHSVNQTQLQPH